MNTTIIATDWIAIGIAFLCSWYVLYKVRTEEKPARAMKLLAFGLQVSIGVTTLLLILMFWS